MVAGRRQWTRIVRQRLGEELRGRPRLAVSRTFSRLQQRGLIAVNARHVVLRDRPALVRMFDGSDESRRATATEVRLH